jgi:hypothetical protein
MAKRQIKRKAPRWSRKRSRIPGHTPAAEFAKEIKVTKDTLRKWRCTGKGPAYIVVARQVHYPDDAKARWLESLRVTPVRSSVLWTN